MCLFCANNGPLIRTKYPKKKNCHASDRDSQKGNKNRKRNSRVDDGGEDGEEKKDDFNDFHLALPEWHQT